MELNFDSEDIKRSFLLRMRELRKDSLPDSGFSSLDNRELLSSLLDMAEAVPTSPTNLPDCLTTIGGQQQTVPTLPIWLCRIIQVCQYGVVVCQIVGLAKFFVQDSS